MTDHKLQLKAVHLRKNTLKAIYEAGADILAEAFGNYFGWEVHRHE